jgi:hypothetical protein
MSEGLRTYKPLLRRGGPLRAVPAGDPATVTSIDDARARAAARKARQERRAGERAELARAAGLAREFPDAAAPGLPDSRFPGPVRLVIATRFGPESRCDLARFSAVSCWGSLQAHHIQPVGMGGRSGPAAAELAVASNGLWCCAAHHTGWTHRHPAAAAALGLLRSRHGGYASLPLSLDGGATWILLDDEGGWEHVPSPWPPDAA